MKGLLRGRMEYFNIMIFPNFENETEEEEYMERLAMADDLEIKEEFIWHPSRKF